MRQIESEYGKSIEDVIRDLYYSRGLTQAEVAEVLGMPAGTLAGWMVRLHLGPLTLAKEAAAAAGASA